MKKYAILAVVLLTALPGCWKKKPTPASPVSAGQTEPGVETVRGYTVTGDADEIILEEELEQDLFDELPATTSATPSTAGSNTDFDTDEIVYDNQSLDPIQFDFDSAKIRPTELNKISNNARIINNELDADDNLRVLVKGHACKIAKSELYNRAISQKRAYHVADEYIKLGVPKARISAIGYGASQLLTNEDGMEAQAINRRVETELVLDNAEKNVRPSAGAAS